MPRALIAAIHHWHSPFQLSSHFAARWLASRGWRVAYLSAPLTPLHWLRPASDDRRARAASWQAGGGRDLDGKLFHYVPFAPYASDNRWPLDTAVVATTWNHLCFPSLGKVLSGAGFDGVDLLYLDNFYHAFWPKRIRHRRLVYHVADDYAGFPGYSHAFGRIERELMDRADALVFPSDELRQALAVAHPGKSVLVPNGVQLADFDRPRPARAERPIAVYVGALAGWFDFPLLAAVARRCPEVDFRLYGPAGSPLAVMPANVRLCGPLPRSGLPEVLASASVGIVPFEVVRHRKLIDPVRPLKVLEYLAAGLPVVSTRWRALEAMAAPIALAGDADDFARQLRAAIASPPEEKRLRAYAADFDWHRLFERERPGLLGDCESHP